MKKYFMIFDLWVSSIMLALIAALMIYEVVMRYLFGNPSAAIAEICSLIFIWFIYLSMSHVTGKREHITIELAKIVLPKSWFPGIVLLSDLIMLAFMVLMTVNGVRLIQSVVRFPFMTSVLELNMIIPYSIIPLAFGVMTVKVLFLLAEDIKALAAGKGGERHA